LDYSDFLKIYISQGSVYIYILTQWRCGGMFSKHFITNFPQKVQVKKIWKSVNIWRIWRRCGRKFVA